MSENRVLADWKHTLIRARKRGSRVCKGCGVEWTPLYLSKLDPGQYKTTCSLECTEIYKIRYRSERLKGLWRQNREVLLKQSSRAGKSSAKKRVKRSKDEISLYELCRSAYKDVSHNSVLVDGWDADIVLNQQKIAILWNGPWHYKQMPHKNHSLKQVQKRDEIKRSRFEADGWRVLVFEDRHYTPSSAFDEIHKIVAG